MLPSFSMLLARLDHVYRGRSYFEGIKARLLAGFSLLIIVFVPFNLIKVTWVQPPELGARLIMNLCWAAAALLALRWVWRGQLTAAGSGLVIGALVPVNLLVLLMRDYPEPVGGALQFFVFNFIMLLLALVFTRRPVAFTLLALIVFGHLGLYYRATRSSPLAGSLEFAADTLLRDGLIAFGFVACFGALLATMIESAHQRSEEALRATRTANENLENLVAERTRDLEAASTLAREASRAKSEFLANMSHEIRTPLNGIIATADLLRDRADLPAQDTDKIRLIADSGELLLRLINDILDFSKIEADKLELEYKPFALTALIADTTALLASTAGRTGVRFSSSIDDALEGYWTGDRYRLQQVLLNLGSNAIKFTPADGTVSLVVSARPGEQGATAVRFDMQDTGIGLDEATQKRIFERFTQADATTTRKYGGSGLGLAISSRLVEAMGGRLEVESAPGQGSCFHFSLPLQPAELPPSSTSPASPSSAPLGLSVLVTDDNPMNRKIIAVQLAKLGCTSMVAEDGESALLRLSEAPLPDVILMDCHMPGIDGWEAARRIRAWAEEPAASPIQRQAAKLPLIALTAAVLPEERRRCLAAGMNDFLAKPARVAELQAVLLAHAPPREA